MTKYECGLTEGDVETGGICPFDDPNETIEDCRECAYAREVEQDDE